MNIDTMRRMDRYAGAALCFFASCVELLRRAIYQPPARFSRVVFLQLSEMGSVIIADAAVRTACRRLGGENVFFAVFSRNRPCLDLSGRIPRENIFVVREKSLRTLLADVLRFAVWARRRRIEAAVDMELFARFSALLAWLSGARIRVGFHPFYNEGCYRGNLVNRRVLYNPQQHMSKNFLAMVCALFAGQPELPFSKTKITDEEARPEKLNVDGEAGRRVLGKVGALIPGFEPGRSRLMLVNPHASDLVPQRNWPAERFAEVMRRALCGHPELYVLVTGAPDEAEEAEAVRRMTGHERCVNFAGKCEFAELPALYSVSALLLTNDSGPAHFAALTDIPVVALYGPETPVLYGSLGRAVCLSAGLACSPCLSAANHRKSPCSANECMLRITAGEVYAHISSILGPGK